MYAVALLPLIYGEYWTPSIIFCITSIIVLKHRGKLFDVPKACLFLLGLLFVGGLSYSLADDITALNFSRDFVVLVNIIFLYLSGNWLGRTNWSSFVSAMKFSAVCYSIYYLIKLGYLLSTAGLNIYETQSYRIQMGAGEFVVVIGLYFYLANLKSHRIVFPVVLLAVALLTQSRTIIIYLALLLLTYINIKTFRNQRSLFFLLICVQVIFMSAFFLSYSSSLTGWQERHDLIGKLLGSFAEILPAYYSKAEVGYFWRGFESYVALEAFKDSNTHQFLFGRGMGTTITLPYDMTLAGNIFSELPFLHNGYASVLLKFGVVGLLLYVAFLLQQLRMAFMIDLRTLYIATVVFTIFATLLMAGPFEKNDFTHVTLLLGALSGRSIGVKVKARRDGNGALYMQGA